LKTLAPLFLALTFTAFAADPATPVNTKELHNVFRIDDTLYSGSGPATEADFKDLAKLGVKVLISVDGGKPAVELAHKYGMRYVHLPIGYDAVPQARADELTKATQTAGGPVYLHCHHGKHRGPSAIAAVCRALKKWTPQQAEEFLKQAGTSPDYAGLYRDVAAFRPPTAEKLAKLPAKFPEVAKTEPLVDAMVAIDEHFDALKVAQKAGWTKTATFPALTPTQTAALIWERYRELARDPAVDKLGTDFRAKLTEAEEVAGGLRDLLRISEDTTEIDAAFKRAAQNCVDCHKAHRN